MFGALIIMNIFLAVIFDGYSAADEGSEGASNDTPAPKGSSLGAAVGAGNGKLSGDDGGAAPARPRRKLSGDDGAAEGLKSAQPGGAPLGKSEERAAQSLPGWRRMCVWVASHRNFDRFIVGCVPGHNVARRRGTNDREEARLAIGASCSTWSR